MITLREGGAYLVDGEKLVNEGAPETSGFEKEEAKRGTMAYSILQFPVGRFCHDAYLPVAGVSVFSIVCLILTALVPWDSSFWHLGRFLIILLLTAGADYFIGLKETERERVRSYLKKKLRRLPE